MDRVGTATPTVSCSYSSTTMYLLCCRSLFCICSTTPTTHPTTTKVRVCHQLPTIYHYLYHYGRSQRRIRTPALPKEIAKWRTRRRVLVGDCFPVVYSYTINIRCIWSHGHSSWNSVTLGLIANPVEADERKFQIILSLIRKDSSAV